jgi:Flp pilus assembly protein TadB
LRLNHGGLVGAHPSGVRLAVTWQMRGVPPHPVRVLTVSGGRHHIGSMLRTRTVQRIRRWWLPGVVLLLIGAGQMVLGVLGYGFGLGLGLGWVVIGMPFLLKTTVERLRRVRQERERGGLRDHANGP